MRGRIIVSSCKQVNLRLVVQAIIHQINRTSFGIEKLISIFAEVEIAIFARSF